MLMSVLTSCFWDFSVPSSETLVHHSGSIFCTSARDIQHVVLDAVVVDFPDQTMTLQAGIEIKSNGQQGVPEL
jgi:hypothetical protein